MHVPNLLESLENNRDNFHEAFALSKKKERKVSVSGIQMQ